MRIRDIALVTAFATAGGCIHANPDPREPQIEQMERGAYGGWIALTTIRGTPIHGELISVEPASISVLSVGEGRLVVVPKAEIAEGSLYKYEREGFLGWGVVGTLSTLSHGFFLVLTVPLWLVWTTTVVGVESGSVVVTLERGRWDEVAMWARFPQGMPAGFGAPGYNDPLAPPPPAPPGAVPR